MNISNYNTFKVFDEHELSGYLGGIKDYIQSLIKNKSEDYILNVNETEFINYLVGEYTASPINIDFAKFPVAVQTLTLPKYMLQAMKNKFLPKTFPETFPSGQVKVTQN